jgi:DNA (cytosine-5)-methyltransferase 1
MILEGFAGPGGWSTALALLGRADSAGVELDQPACLTATAAGHRRVRADVAAFPLDHLAGRVEGVVMSPPCQAWSRAGKRLGLLDQPRIFDHLAAVTTAGRWVDYDRDGWHDARSPLVLEVARWVSVLRPAWVACEQVPDVLPFWQAMCRWLRRLGYSTACGLLSAERFGVPQTRCRAFLVARPGGSAQLPLPTHEAYTPGLTEAAGPGLFGGSLLPWVSMADALGWAADRPARTVCGDRSPRWAYGAGATSYGTGWTLRTNQVPAGMGGGYQRRPASEPSPAVSGQGCSWAWERPATAVLGDPRLAGPGHRDREGGRRQFDEQAVHVGVEQAAVLQSFPPDYPWQGTKTARFRQVGDAVPPLLAAAVLGELLGVDWRRRLWGLEDAA